MKIFEGENYSQSLCMKDYTYKNIYKKKQCNAHLIPITTIFNNITNNSYQVVPYLQSYLKVEILIKRSKDYIRVGYYFDPNWTCKNRLGEGQA